MALHHVKIKFTKVQLTQTLEIGHSCHFHGNIYTHCAECYIEIYGVIQWTPTYVDKNNVRVASKLHVQITVKPVIVLPYEITMDKDPNKIYNHADPTPHTVSDHQITLLLTVTAIISNIMTDDTVNMATL